MFEYVKQNRKDIKTKLLTYLNNNANFKVLDQISPKCENNIKIDDLDENKMDFEEYLLPTEQIKSYNVESRNDNKDSSEEDSNDSEEDSENDFKDRLFEVEHKHPTDNIEVNTCSVNEVR